MKSIDNAKYVNMKNPKLVGGFTFNLNKDFDKDEVEKVVNLKCKSFLLTKDAKINPITKKEHPVI